MAKAEYPIDEKDYVWINHQPVEPGTYDRYSTDGTMVVLKRPNNQEEELNLEVLPVYLQHKQRRSHFDTTSPLPCLISTKLFVDSRSFYLDELCPEFYPCTQLNKQVPPVWVTAEDLRQVGSKGFVLENCGFKDVCSIDDLIGIYKDPQQDRITIYRIMGGKLQHSSYRLSKITNEKALS